MASSLPGVPPQSAAVGLPRLPALGVAAVLVIVAQLPILLNDGLFADDWLEVGISANLPLDLGFLLAAGHPFEYALFSVANAFAQPILFQQLIAFGSVVVGCLVLCDIALRLNAVRPAEAVVIALMALAYPGYELWAGKGTAGYVACYGLLLVGARLWLALVERGSKFSPLLRGAALLCFFVSFSLNSIIVLFVLALPTIGALYLRRGSPGIGAGLLVARTLGLILRRHWDFVLLPFVFWLALNALFPRKGAYAEYYAMKFGSLRDWANGIEGFFQWGVTERLREGIALLHAHSWIVVIALAIGAVAIIALHKRDTAARPFLMPFALAAAGFLVLSLPYVLAGVGPSAHFYESRHLLLFGLPSGLAVVSVSRLAGRLERRWLADGVLAVAVGVTIAATWNAHFFLQARWLEMEAMIDHLRTGWPQPPALVFNLENGFENAGDRYVYYGFFEVSGALHVAWGNRPFVGFTLAHERPQILAEIGRAAGQPFGAVHNMDVNGPQGTIVLTPTAKQVSNQRMALGYYACRLRPDCDVSGYVAGLADVSVTVGPIAGLEARQ